MISFRCANRTGSWIWSVLSGQARRWTKPVHLGVRTISVGNIQAGGAGKTPLVAEIAREAGRRGMVVCILCRGYGGEWEAKGAGGMIAPGDSGLDTGLCGDEAALLHDLAPEAWIGVGSDRRAQFERVRTRAKQIDLVILDDGFQHHRLDRDVDVVAVTSADRGERIFRDFHGALKRADLVVWTKGERAPADAGAPMVRVKFRLPEADFSVRVCLVTGLADGESALNAAKAAGYRVERHIPFRDHARYAESVVRTILEDASRNGLRVAVTGKDWVKWREMKVDVSPPVLVLEPKVEFSSEADQKTWNRILWGENPA